MNYKFHKYKATFYVLLKAFCLEWNLFRIYCCYSVLHCSALAWKIYSFFYFIPFFLLFSFVYFLERRVRFEFVAHLENILILIRQLSSYLFHDLFICFYICYLFYASCFYASLLFLFYLQLNGKCFISFFILQWFGKFVLF